MLSRGWPGACSLVLPQRIRRAGRVSAADSPFVHSARKQDSAGQSGVLARLAKEPDANTKRLAPRCCRRTNPGTPGPSHPAS